MMERDNRIIVIGAGIAGLTAGIYALRSGYKVLLVERGPVPGGLCSSWRRGGYLFDGSAAGLAGTSPETPLRRLWEELGVIGRCELVDPDNFGSIRLSDGRTATVWTDINRLEAHFIDLFPRDAEHIRDFAKALTACAGIDIQFSGGAGGNEKGYKVKALLRMIQSLPALLRYSKMTLRDFLGRLSDPACRIAFENIVHFGGFDRPLLSILLPLAYAHKKATGIPRKGWLAFARSIEAKFLSLGGELRYDSSVTGLIASSLDSEGHPRGRVLGVMLADGSEIRANRVLSTIDGRFTNKTLLHEDEDAIARTFKPEDLSDQPVQVNLGVAEDWSSVRGPLTLILPEAMVAAGKPQSKITIHNKYYDPSAAPESKSSLSVFLESSYAFWAGLKGDRAAYEAEKIKCANLVIGAIEKERQGFSGNIEVVEVSTPLTRERYTGNWMGAMQARKPGKSIFKALISGGPRYAFAQLAGFYRAGQWTESWGGITTAAQSGRNAIKAMCRHDRVPFDGVAVTPG